MSDLDQRWLRDATSRELLAGYASILSTLRDREVVRSNNAPAGDYAETLVAKALGGRLVEHFSVKSHDLVAKPYGRVQVKARVVSNPPKASQLGTSPFRSWDFEYGCFVLFNAEDYSVRRAVLVSVDIARELRKPRPHVAGDVVVMNDALMNAAGRKDITDRLARAASTL